MQSDREFEISGSIADETTQRILSHVFWGQSWSRTKKVKLIVGELPDDLPFHLPIPTDTTIIGTLVNYGDITVYSVLLDIYMSPQDIPEFYSNELQTQGFAPSDAVVEPHHRHLHRADGVSFTVNASDIENAPSAVRMQILSGLKRESLMSRDEMLTLGRYWVDRVVLAAPPGIEHRRGVGSGGGVSGATSRHEARSALPPNELMSLYYPQLQERGWHFVDMVHIDMAAWSTWQVKDSSGNLGMGVLTILAKPNEPGVWSLELSVECFY